MKLVYVANNQLFLRQMAEMEARPIPGADGDAIVFFRRSDVVVAGDVLDTTRFLRHGDILTVLAVVEYPIYLAEPWILSKSFQLSPTPLPAVGPPCVTTYEGGTGESVPHYLPEKSPFIDELTMKYQGTGQGKWGLTPIANVSYVVKTDVAFRGRGQTPFLLSPRSRRS